MNLRVAWVAADPAALAAVGEWMGARIVLQNDYISHGELQAGLSLDGVTWSPDAAAAIGNQLRSLAPGSLTWAVEACDAATGLRLGAAIVRWADDDAARHGVLEDLVVDRAARRKGVAAALVTFVEKAARDRGARWLFLESGLANTEAHEFFEGQGFRPISKVFVKAV